MKAPHIEPGTWRIYRADGTQEEFTTKPSIRQVSSKLGYDTLDSVNLRGNGPTIMMVCDTGMIDGLPSNAKANEFMQAVNPGYPYPICGDVAILNDRDFA
jgi:hypothetical protein